MTCLLFCEHLDTLLAEKSFSLDLRAFLILMTYFDQIFYHVLIDLIFDFF